MSPTFIRLIILVVISGIVPLAASAFPPSGCVALCGDTSSGSSSGGWGGSWDRPPPDTDSEPAPPRMSSREREGFLTAQKAYSAWKRGDEESALLLYQKAYELYPGNDSIRRSLCVALRNRAAGILNAQGNLTLALRYANDSLAVCPEDNDTRIAIDEINAEAERQAAWARSKLLNSSIKERVKFYVQELEAHMERMTKPPNAFEFAVPGTSMFSRGTKTSAPVDVAAPSGAGTVSPEEIQEKTASLSEGLRTDPVPPPNLVESVGLKEDPLSVFSEDEIPVDGAKTANLILDALQAGDGELAESLDFIAEHIHQQGADADSLTALSYLQGLWIGDSELNSSGGENKSLLEISVIERFLVAEGIEWEKGILGSVSPETADLLDRRWVYVRDAMNGETKLDDATLNLVVELMSEEKPMSERDPRDAAALTAAFYQLLGLEAYVEWAKSR